MTVSRNRRRASLFLGGALISLTAALPAPVLAQDAGASDADAPIIVTARRRDESLVEVPLSVTAVTGEQLEQSGALDITEVAETVPNVTFEVSRGTNTTLTTFIRGVGQQDPVSGFENGVGLYVDDVYYNRPQGAVLDVFDVERIEVLRGPQGTLYGRNTIGGAVKFVTRRLSDSPTGAVRFTVGNYNQLDGVASLAIPVGDTGLYVGGAAALLTRGGFGENLNLTGFENYNKDVFAARATIEYAPNSDVFIRLTGDYTDDHSDPRQGHRLIPGLVSGAPVLDNVYDTRAGLDFPRQHLEARGASLTAQFQLTDTLMLRNILAYREDESSTPIDFDSLPAQDVDVPAIYTNDQFSEELQLVYEGESLAGLLGFYYLDASSSTNFDVILATTGAIIPPPGGPLPGLTAKTFGEVDTETWSVFGDFTWDITEQFSVSVGGRYTHDERSSVVFRQSLLFGPSPEFGGDGVFIGLPTSDFQGDATWNRFTPRASISFRPTPDQNIYLSYSRGFKGGGFDPRGQSNQAPDLDGNGTRDPDEIYDYMAFSPETVDSYELGYRAAMFDNGLTFALAAFYADYTDIQVPGSQGADTNGDGINDTFIGVTTNAGAATIWGIEFEGRARLARDLIGVGDRLGFNWAAGYIDAQYDEFIVNDIDVSDARVFQNTPEWTLAGTLDYSFPAFGGQIGMNTTLSYRSLTNQFEVPNALLDQPGYALWDASVTWVSDDDHWSLGLHAKNLTDERYIVSGYNFINPVTGAAALGREGVLTAYYGDPFRIFATAGMRF